MNALTFILLFHCMARSIFLLFSLSWALALTARPVLVGDDARQRTREALAEHGPVDRFVKEVILAVDMMPKDKYKESCWRYIIPLEHMALGDEDQDLIVIRSNPKVYTPMIVAQLKEMGFEVKEFHLNSRSVTCDCARPPKDWDGVSSYVVCAAACFEGPYLEVCW